MAAAGLGVAGFALALATGTRPGGTNGLAPEALLLMNGGMLFIIGLAAALSARVCLAPPPAFGFPGGRAVPANVLLGVAIGGAAMCGVAIGFLLTGGDAVWRGLGAADTARTLLTGACAFLVGAIGEEWVFRHYLLYALVPIVGVRGAIGITALAFASVHVTNPGGTSLVAMLDIVVAGVGLGIAAWVGRSLWIPVAWHATWNFMMGSVLGLPVSGYDIGSVAILAPAGPTWWTGGHFGPEAGVLGLLIDTLVVILFILVVRALPRDALREA